MDEIIYKISLFSLLIVFSMIKIRLTKKHVKNDEEGNKYPLYINLPLALSGISIFCLPAIYVFTNWFDQFNMDLPDFIRLTGVFVFILSTFFMVWVLQVLGLNISTIHKDRHLVQTGPYKYIRHPLYSVFCFIAISICVIASNWLLLIPIIIIIPSMLIRIHYEERLLLNEYGNQYKLYSEKTGKLLPRTGR